MTYRIGPHTTADDAGRYRDEAEVERWRAQDPIARYRTWLLAAGHADEAFVADCEAQADARVAQIRADLVAPRRRPPSGCSTGRTRIRRRRSCASGRRRSAMPEITMSGRAEHRAPSRARRGSARARSTDEDVGALGGVFRVTDGLQEEFGAERVFDTPIAEAGMTGAAVGLALAGWKAVVEMQFDGFSYPALDQVISHVAKYRERTRGRVEMPITIRIPSFGGIRGKEHHGESPETYYVHTAGLKVVVPSSAAGRVPAAPPGDRRPRPRDRAGAQGPLLGEGGRAS